VERTGKRLTAFARPSICHDGRQDSSPINGPAAIVQDARSPTDSELVVAALRNAGAYAPLVRRWEPALARYVRRILGRESQTADDVLQEIFLKAYVNLNDFDLARPFGPWIYRIAHNEAISQLRRNRAAPPLVTGEDALLLLERMSDGVTAQEILDRKRIEYEVRMAIGRLKPRYREALMLRYLEEKSYDEIAEVLALPGGTVATLINRGTRQLREMLKLAVSKDLL
jgi:RNA polymerase sigma-70 factor, ECF subfamily